MKQIGLALQNYYDAHERFPPGRSPFAVNNSISEKFWTALARRFSSAKSAPNTPDTRSPVGFGTTRTRSRSPRSPSITAVTNKPNTAAPRETATKVARVVSATPPLTATNLPTPAGAEVYFKPVVVPADFDEATTTVVSDASVRCALSAPAGEYSITVHKIEQSGDSPTTLRVKNVFPEQYADPSSSGLSVDVQKNAEPLKLDLTE